LDRQAQINRHYGSPKKKRTKETSNHLIFIVIFMLQDIGRFFTSTQSVITVITTYDFSTFFIMFIISLDLDVCHTRLAHYPPYPPSPAGGDRGDSKRGKRKKERGGKKDEEDEVFVSVLCSSLC